MFMNKYVKVMFGNVSSSDENLHYKIDEVNVSDNFNPDAKDAKEMGGFNFSTLDKILRWLVRGDTLYDVSFPDDAEIIGIDSKAAPNGVLRTNKIIISNPRIIDDDLALYLYEKSNLPEESYYKSLAGLMIRGCYNTSLRLIRDRINKNNIKNVLEEIKSFCSFGSDDGRANMDVYNSILDILKEIDSDLLICINVDKAPYIKKITDDKVINLTGENGSGKSYYSTKYKNDDNYVVIDTDNIINDGNDSELKSVFEKKLGSDLKSILTHNFDECYEIILDYYKGSGKTIVIDSAYFRYLKDLTKLKGEIIVLRTSVDLCFKRCIDRFNRMHASANKVERDNYKYKKKKIYTWYKYLNDFLVKVDEL